MLNSINKKNLVKNVKNRTNTNLVLEDYFIIRFHMCYSIGIHSTDGSYVLSSLKTLVKEKVVLQ